MAIVSSSTTHWQFLGCYLVVLGFYWKHCGPFLKNSVKIENTEFLLTNNAMELQQNYYASFAVGFAPKCI